MKVIDVVVLSIGIVTVLIIVVSLVVLWPGSVDFIGLCGVPVVSKDAIEAVDGSEVEETLLIVAVIG